MKRILVYSRTFLPTLGGMERNTLTLARLLHDWGHEVTVFTETLEEDNRLFPFTCVRSKKILPLIKALLKSDLVMINGGLAAKACLPSFVLKRPYIPIYQMATAAVESAESSSRSALRQLLMSRAKAHITVSQNDKDHFLRSHPDAICFAVPNPIDRELVEASLKCQQNSIKDFDLLYSGRLIEGKGIFQLLEALYELKSRLPLRTAFAGQGPEAERLAEEARRLGVPITLLGRLDLEKLVEVYHRSKVLVVPSSTHSEGYPLVISEAMTLGLPVIASDQSVMVEGVGDAGRCFRRHDVKSLADTILWMFSDDNLEKCVANTVSRRDNVSCDRYEARMTELFDFLSLRSNRGNRPT